MASKPAPSLSAHSSKTNVRRNLFHHQLSRRPTSTSVSMSGSSLQEPLPDNASDIVVKDCNGNYEVDIPLLPPLDEEQIQEEDEAAMEKERQEARLLEMWKDKHLQPSDPAELYAAVQAKLRRVVASLDEDNWMFEAEQQTSGG